MTVRVDPDQAARTFGRPSGGAGIDQSLVRPRSGGTGGRPSPGARRRGAGPRPRRRGGAGPRGCRARPRRRHSSALARGITGDASSATIRSASRQSPSDRGDRVGVARLVELPRLLVLDVGVGGADQVPHRAERGRVVEPRRARSMQPANVGRGRGRERAVGPGVGHDAVAVVDGHVEHAVGEVAEVVGEIGVVARHHRLVREVAVGTEALVGEEVVAEPVAAEVGHEVGRRDLVEPRSCSSSRRPRAGSRGRTRTSAAPRPAAMSIAGQYTAWKRRMSLPTRW